MTGRQLFTIDSFRNTGRPLLSVLADPNCIFINRLSKFKRRSLYANTVNDTAVFYTTGISKIDTFDNLSQTKLNYIKDHEPVIVDIESPVSAVQQEVPTMYSQFSGAAQTVLNRLQHIIALFTLIPIRIIIFLINAVVQSFRSSYRIKLHEAGIAMTAIASYRIPMLMEVVRETVEEADKNLDSGPGRECQIHDTEESAINPNDIASSSAIRPRSPIERAYPQSPLSPKVLRSRILSLSRTPSKSKPNHGLESQQSQRFKFTILPVTPHQLAMIQALDHVGFKKYPVYIWKTTHSHAVIIVRMQWRNFDEGKVVVRHWLESFEI